MTLLLPSQAVDLPGGYRWAPQLVTVNAWQAHLLKHPLGLRSTRRLGAIWDYEGWTKTTPPVVDADMRDGVFEQIRALSAGGQPCGVPEVFGVASQSDPDRPECYSCPQPLVDRCAEVLKKENLSARYAQETEAVVSALRDGVILKRKQLTHVLYTGVKRPEVWRDLVVMSRGAMKAGGEGLRITRGDGVRVQLEVHQGDRLAWYTTYRLPEISGRSGGWGFLVQTLAQGSRTFLSDAYVVSRAWWETHGN